MTTTTARLVVDALIDNGFDQLYCLPGIQNDAFFDELYYRTNQLNPVHARHEQGAAYMALGAALATGKPQAYCVVPGPGFLNSTGALCTAYAMNAPVLALVGQIGTAKIGKSHGVLHEIPDQLSILRSLTKRSEHVGSGDQAANAVEGALAALFSGRPRPVGLEVPFNVWSDAVPMIAARFAAQPEPSPEPDPDKIKKAARLISKARYPMIVVGSGGQPFSEEIARLTDMASAAIVAFRQGQGVVSSEHPLRIGMPVAHHLWKSVDLVIGLGTRMSTHQQDWGVDDDLNIIHIDIDPEEIGRIVEPTVGIHADLKDALPELLRELESQSNRRSDWRRTIGNAKAQFDRIYAKRLAPQLAFLNAIRAELPRDGIFVDEVTQIGYASRFLFPTYKPRTFISTGFQGTLGYGFATALGAAHARRDVPVVSISGDGGALYTISELATAVHHNIPLKAIVFNDNSFGNVRRIQMEAYEGRTIASDLTSPDFVKLAEAYGAQGLKAVSPQELRMRLRDSFKHDGPSLIEVPVGEFPSPWEFILMPRIRG